MRRLVGGRGGGRRAEGGGGGGGPPPPPPPRLASRHPPGDRRPPPRCGGSRPTARTRRQSAATTPPECHTAARENALRTGTTRRATPAPPAHRVARAASGSDDTSAPQPKSPSTVEQRPDSRVICPTRWGCALWGPRQVGACRRRHHRPTGGVKGSRHRAGCAPAGASAGTRPTPQVHDEWHKE